MKRINIAIDGHSSCGKSTTSRLLAARLRYKYIDTGAMYRAVTLYFLEHGVDCHDLAAVTGALAEIQLDFEAGDSGENHILLNHSRVDREIRGMEVSGRVSEVSAVSAVRRHLVALQRNIAQGKGVVMDGRDIGTVVLPDAELKVFMTASTEVRALRRWKELQAKGTDIPLEEVRANLERRDHLDSSRADSPLMQAPDALLLDTSGMTIDDQVDWIYRRALERAGA